MIEIDGIQTHAHLDTGAGSSYASAKLIEALHKKPKQVCTCALDVLGLADTHENDQQAVYKEFKEQLVRDEAGWYQTSLPWKGNHPPLPMNDTGSKKRLEHLVRKLKKNELYEDYNNIIQEQLQQGIVEPAPEQPSENEFYIPHKAVVKKGAESTQLRIVYDASARENNGARSLNDCLHPGPALQNQLWDILSNHDSTQFYSPVTLRKHFYE